MFLQPGWLIALLASAFFAFGFVASLYVWKGSTTIDKDEPQQIKRRCLSIIVVSICSPLLFYLFDDGTKEGPSIWVWVGMHSQQVLVAMVLPLFLTMLLFSGSLVIEVLTIRDMRSEVPEEAWLSTFRRYVAFCVAEPWDSQTNLIPLRNYVIAPLAEELVFRVCICTLLVAGGWSHTTTAIISPALFGVAHLHHLLNLVRSRGLGLAQGLATVGFMLFYTTIFGLYASCVYLRTGHLVSVVLCHSFCNIMGFPPSGWLSPKHPYNRHKYLIGGSFIMGIIAFSLCFELLLDPTLYNAYIWFELPSLARELN